MLRADERNKNTREAIKSSWEEGDILGILTAGFENFMQMVIDAAPMPFSKFLEYTGASFDHYILETCKQERLNYVGGTMLLKLSDPQPIGNPQTAEIQLFADFYFQTAKRQWIVKKKTGHVNSSRFCDWMAAPSALELQKTGELKLSIEPPEIEAK